MRLQRAYTSRPDEVGHHGGYGWPRWRWLLPPVAVAGVALVLLMLSWIVGPSDVLIPLGVKPPPVAVTREPGFFKDYPLIEHLDVLEHFDTVESEPLDDDQQAQRG